MLHSPGTGFSGNIQDTRSPLSIRVGLRLPCSQIIIGALAINSYGRHKRGSLSSVVQMQLGYSTWLRSSSESANYVRASLQNAEWPKSVSEVAFLLLAQACALLSATPSPRYYTGSKGSSRRIPEKCHHNCKCFGSNISAVL